ncbi:CatB-related O-acetyltransferase [Clostridium perfringens]|nr:CatB-related O-acetyltransferase [Clostridium perfringens]
MILGFLKYKLKINKLRNEWRKRNKHNYTKIGDNTDINKIKVGNYTYGVINAHFFDNPLEQLEIGSYCSIAGKVKFLCGGEHNYKKILSFPIEKYFFNSEFEALAKGPIIVEDDVWIGEGALILSGVTLGQGSIIAAGSIICKNVPPYAITDGKRIIKYRFSDEIINELLKLDLSKIDKKILIKHKDLFNKEITYEDIPLIHKVLLGENYGL